MEYDYPLNYDWSVDEIITITSFYNLIEDAYEIGIDSNEIIAAYKQFKTIVNSIAEEKQLDQSFMLASGYSIYRTVKAAKEKNGMIKMVVSR